MRKSQVHNESLLTGDPYRTSKYRKRYVIVALFSTSIIMNLSLGICFSPIQTNLENIYVKSIFIVNFCTRLIGNVATPPFNFLANFVLDHYGLKPGIFIGNITSLISLWISVLAKDSFYYIFAGQIISSIGHAFLLSAPQKISVTWFAANERVIATTIMSMSILLGNAVGAQFPNFFVDNDASGNSGLEQVYNMLFFMAILGTVLIAPSFFFFREKPLHPPSKAAETKKLPYIASLRELFGNKNTFFLIIGASFIFGTNMTIASVLQFLLQPFGFTNAEISYYITFSIVLGFVGSLAISSFVSRTKKYKITIIGLSITATSLLVMMIFSTQSENPYFMGAIFCLFGLVVNPIYPLIVEFLCELSFPVGEATAGGIFYVLGQVVGTGESFAADALMKGQTKNDALNTFYMMIAVDILGILCFLVVTQDLKRIKFESKKVKNPEQRIPGSLLVYEPNGLEEASTSEA